MNKEDLKIEDWVLAINVHSLIHHWRTVKDMSQKELAEKVGTKQEAIARLERSNYTPSLRLLIKIANALGKRLEIRFK